MRQLATPYYDELTVLQNLLYSGLQRSLKKDDLFERIQMVLHEVSEVVIVLGFVCLFVVQAE